MSLKRGEDAQEKRGVGRISRTLHRWKTALRKVTKETLDGLDEESQGDKTVDVLFYGNAGTLKKVPSIGRDSGTSMSPVGVSELNITTEAEESLTESSVESARNSNNAAEGEEQGDCDEAKEVTFKNYNAVAECAKLQKKFVAENKPFCGAGEVWERRRALWVQPTDAEVDRDERQRRRDERQRRRDVFATIPKSFYTRIYRNLVLDDKPLRESMNLQDALKVVNAGWIETKKWENAAKRLS